MFLLYIKGRGYYNGHSQNTRNNWERRQNNNNSDDYFYHITHKIIFKRNYNDVKSSNTFNSKKEAQKIIDDINSIISKDTSYTETRTISSWGKFQARTCTTHYTVDISKLEKVADRLEIVKEDEYLILKKTNRINNIWKGIIRKPKGDDVICSTCRINMTIDEPYYAVDSIYMCKHCMESAWNDLSSAFDKHPNSEDITTAWQAEMVTREL